MARPLKEIEQELLNLPQAERARLAHRLIVSLDEDVPADEAMRQVDEALKQNKK